MVGRLRVLAMDASNLDMELVGNLLELSHLGSEFWKSNVHRSSQSCAEIGWARRDVAKMFVVSKLGNLLNLCSSL